jgi:hypothetical protein
MSAVSVGSSSSPAGGITRTGALHGPIGAASAGGVVGESGLVPEVPHTGGVAVRSQTWPLGHSKLALHGAPVAAAGE